MNTQKSCKEEKILHYKGKFQNAMYAKASKPPKQKDSSKKTKIETESENKMKLFKGQIEVKETDIVKVYSDYLTVFDKNCNQTYYEDSKYWSKREYDKNGNEKYFENSKGDWEKREFDKNGNMTYYENSSGKIIDKRFKEMTVAEIEKELGYKIKIKGE